MLDGSPRPGLDGLRADAKAAYRLELANALMPIDKDLGLINFEVVRPSQAGSVQVETELRRSLTDSLFALEVFRAPPEILAASTTAVERIAAQRANSKVISDGGSITLIMENPCSPADEAEFKGHVESIKSLAAKTPEVRFVVRLAVPQAEAVDQMIRSSQADFYWNVRKIDDVARTASLSVYPTSSAFYSRFIDRVEACTGWKVELVPMSDAESRAIQGATNVNRYSGRSNLDAIQMHKAEVQLESGLKYRLGEANVEVKGNYVVVRLPADCLTENFIRRFRSWLSGIEVPILFAPEAEPQKRPLGVQLDYLSEAIPIGSYVRSGPSVAEPERPSIISVGAEQEAEVCRVFAKTEIPGKLILQKRASSFDSVVQAMPPDVAELLIQCADPEGRTSAGEFTKSFDRFILGRDVALNFSTSVSRKDYTGITTNALDRSGTRLHEDAFSVERCGDSFRLMVHISDGASIIEQGSYFEHSARKRGVSEYSGSTLVRPLFPRNVNTWGNFFSGAIRPAWTVTFEVDSTNGVVSSSLERSLVKIRRMIEFESIRGMTSSDQFLRDWIDAAKMFPANSNWNRVPSVKMFAVLTSGIIQEAEKVAGAVMVERGLSYIGVRDAHGRCKVIKPDEHIGDSQPVPCLIGHPFRSFVSLVNQQALAGEARSDKELRTIAKDYSWLARLRTSAIPDHVRLLGELRNFATRAVTPDQEVSIPQLYWRTIHSRAG